MVGELVAARRIDDPLDRLSHREREAFALMAQGMSDSGFAEQLYVPLNTVGTHARHIFRKLELPDEPSDNRRVLAVLTLSATRRA